MLYSDASNKVPTVKSTRMEPKAGAKYQILGMV